MNYYNEFDPFAARWLRELIKAGLIPNGDVDERSIIDVRPDELREYTQCHFFAGIGGWSLALRLAGWPSDRPVWTGSCPCQPFSSAGNQKGKADERHLWPVWFGLIRECRPSTIFGEQVASAVTHGWLDDVYQGLESEGYACGSAVLPACSVGAPHKRDRLWFVANSENVGRRGWVEEVERERSENQPIIKSDIRGKLIGSCLVGHSEHDGSLGGSITESDGEAVSDSAKGQNSARQSSGASQSGDVADTIDARSQGYRRLEQEPVSQGWQGTERHPWSSGVWIDCPDGKQRLVEPSIRLLAHGVSNRVGKLRGYGNAIVPQVAARFIGAYMECS